MGKVKLVIDNSNISLCKSLTEFFHANKIDFEIIMENLEGKPATKAAEVVGEFIETKVNKNLDEKITNIFVTVGIPAHIKGYRFLREAVKLTIGKPEIINSITKQLYPRVAQKFDTTSSKVERAIRHAIEVGWNRGRAEHINNIFGVRAFEVRDKPTNGEFIAIVADRMILEGA